MVENKDFLLDSRPRSWFWDYNDVFDNSNLSPQAKLVRLYLARCADNAKRQAFPSLNKIAEKCGLSRSTVKRAISELIEKRWLIKETRRDEDGVYTSNLYTLCHPGYGAPSSRSSHTEAGGRSTENLPCHEMTGGRSTENLPCHEMTGVGSQRTGGWVLCEPGVGPERTHINTQLRIPITEEDPLYDNTNSVSNSSLRSELETERGTEDSGSDMDFDSFYLGEIEPPEELFKDNVPRQMCTNDTEESSGTDTVSTKTSEEASTNQSNAHARTSNVTECSYQPNTRARTTNVTECSHESFNNMSAQGKTYRSLSGYEEQYPEGCKNHLRRSESTGYPLPDAVEPKKNNTSAGIKNKASSASKEVLRSGPTSSDTEDSLNKTPGEGNTLSSNAGPWGKENIDFSPGINKNILISSGDRTDIRDSNRLHGRSYENTLSGANSNKAFSTGSAANERRTDELRDTFVDTPSGVDSIELISTGTPDNAPVEEGPNRTEDIPADALDKAPSSGVTTGVREPDIHRKISGKPAERVSGAQDGTLQMQAMHPGISLRTADIIAMLGDSLREVMDPPAKAYAIAGRLYNLYDFPAAEAAINALRRKIEQGQKVRNPVAYLMKVARLKKQEFETGDTEDDDDELKPFSVKYPEEHRKRLEEVKRIYAERQKHLEEYLACTEVRAVEVEGFKSPLRALLGPT